MLGDSALVAFVGISDLGRARAFYGDVLGLELRDEAPYALVAEVAGTMLRITAVGGPVAAPYTVLGWRVTDIGQHVTDLAAKGVRFNRYEGMDQDERGVWTAPGGARIAWFPDPDGNNLSLTEMPGD
jgi:predicted enzyme related to lactoylglutathione lyase